MFALSLWVLLAVADATLGTESSTNYKRDPVSWSNSQCNVIPVSYPVNPAIECASIAQVPLDYADLSKGTVKLQMARILATVQPSRGGIFLNPGGPGGSGTRQITNVVGEYPKTLGQDWDFIGWDPRGVALSEPTLSQPTTYEEILPIWNSTIHKGEFSAHGNLTNQADVVFFMGQAPIVDTALQKWNQMLVDRNGANLKYIGTTASVRDIVTMSDALYGRDQDINFYGMSYGTFVGIILTQMFPNRIGKVILDGVMNPQAVAEYLPILNADEQLADAAAGLNGFYEACALAGPSSCSLESNYTTASQIQGVVEQWRNNLHDNWPSHRYPPIMDSN